MRESISNALIFTLVITFLFIFMLLFAASTAYTKAFKVKNKIINILEKRENTIIKFNNSGKLPGSVEEEIEAALGEVGYRMVLNNDVKCETDLKNRFKSDNYKLVNVKKNGYRYCIAEFYDGRQDASGRKEKHSVYYAVITYMYFEVPLIGQGLEFPVYGETKTFNIIH